jgi:Colicin D
LVALLAMVLASTPLSVPASSAAKTKAVFFVAAEGGLAPIVGGSQFPDLTNDVARLEAKFRHAADFGVTQARGASGFRTFGESISNFVTDPTTTRIAGTYRGDPAVLNCNAASRLVVVQQQRPRAIWTGFRMRPAQLAKVDARGSLGGG